MRGERARETVGGLVTQDVAGLAAGRAGYAFLLTPKGRPITDLRALVFGPDRVWLDLPVTSREETLAHLGKYLNPRFAAFEPMQVTRLSVVGPRAAAVLGAVTGGDALDDPAELTIAPLGTDWIGPTSDADAAGEDVGSGPETEGEPLALRRERIEGPGFDLYLPDSLRDLGRNRLLEACRTEGGGEAGREACEVWRIERGIPIQGAEIHEGVLPQETGQQGRAIDFEKGCYTGQEVVAKIHFRGRVNRHLRGLVFGEGEGEGEGEGSGSTGPEVDALEESPLPGPGTELYAGDRARGVITATARSPRLGAVGLGYVRREIEAGERLALEPGGKRACRVVELPFIPPPEPGETRTPAT